MEDESQDPRGFRVVDKRRFTEAGDLRAESAPSEKRERMQEQPRAERPPRPTGEATELTGEAEMGSPDYAPTLDFPSFLVSLATQAMMMMGEMPHPDSNAMHVNLDAARQTVDIIAILEEKTRGNLTAQEERLMAEILSSLRMAYVKKRQQIG
ncbi:MAG: DUF1844 domain-containing protein [Bdellovibrionales bacterium]|nr:DUF1844 domain-containing protein [Bdellovibrionales bacterium]